MDARAHLVSLRPHALAYADSLAALPASLVGLSARVSGVAIYPVKGFGPVPLARAAIGRRGLFDPTSGLADRSLMLAYRSAGTTPDGEAFDAVGIANRNEAAVARTHAALADGALSYEAPGLPRLVLDPAAFRAREGSRIRVKLPYAGGPVVDGVLDEGPLAEWAADLFRANPARRRFHPEEVVAVRQAPGRPRAIAERHRAGEDAATIFGDAGHVLVASASTLEWMNAAFRAEGKREIAMEVFRPNIVLEGLPANAEDLVHEVEIRGGAEASRLVFATRCTRCDATRVDPATGTRPDKEPLAWLARNRPGREDDPNGATFAVNAVFPAASEAHIVAVGDPVRVRRER